MKPSLASVPARFLACVSEHGLLTSGDRVLVAVSGGADSVALLDLLLVVRPRFRLGVRAFHLDHGLRRQSRADAEFVRSFCSKRGVALELREADVAGLAQEQGLGIEEAGRELRHALLDEAADQLGCSKIALGHTADDNLETMLLHLVRGTGPHGLGGIRVRRGRIIRPLLDIEHRDLVRYLRSRGITWIEDETNRDPRFRRNRLRRDVVPALVAMNPQVKTNARRTAHLLAAEDEFLDDLAAAAVRDLGGGSGRWEIDTRMLESYNQCLKRRILKQLLPELDAAAVDAALRFAAAGSPGRLSLTRGTRIRLARGRLSIERKLGDSR